jgi:predicted PilT family ATPase
LQSTEFDIDKEYVSRVVGAHGAGINRLRDQLGVKVDVSDDVDERERESNKKRKVVHQKSRVKVLLSSTVFVHALTSKLDYWTKRERRGS